MITRIETREKLNTVDPAIMVDYVPPVVQESVPSVLDILREIIDDIQSHEGWPIPDFIGGIEKANTYFHINISTEKIVLLFAGLRKLVDDGTFLHSHDMVLDEFNFFFTSDEIKIITPPRKYEVVSHEYYALMISKPWVLDMKKNPRKIINNLSDIHVLYSVPAQGSSEIERTDLWFNDSLISIEFPKINTDEYSSVGVFVDPSNTAILSRHLRSMYIREMGI